MLGAAKDKHLLHLGVFQQQLFQECSLAALVDTVQFLTDAFNGRALGRDLHTDRIRPEDCSGKLGDVVGHGGAKEQILALLRQERHHLTDIVDEPHVQHAVGLIQHKEFQGLQGDRLLADKVQQTPRSCHQHVNTPDQAVFLGGVPDAAKDAGTGNSRELGVLLETLLHLDGKFPSRKQDQGPAGLGRTELSGIQKQLRWAFRSLQHGWHAARGLPEGVQKKALGSVYFCKFRLALAAPYRLML